MTTTLITGGNKGLGFETARRLLAQGHKVFIGSRDESRGIRAAQQLGATFVQLDVTTESSIEAAAATVRAQQGHLDVLINNAGIAGGLLAADELTAEAVKRIYDTNVFGVIRVIHAFLPLLHKSEAPVIVNVSSGLGSFAAVADLSRIESKVYAADYNSSKAALNMLTVQYAKLLPSMRVNAVDPGYTATDLNHHSGPQTVSEGTDAIVKMASIGKHGPTGTFSNRQGLAAW